MTNQDLAGKISEAIEARSKIFSTDGTANESFQLGYYRGMFESLCVHLDRQGVDVALFLSGHISEAHK
jgi:hypothetical protein